ncbi:MAG: ADP-ribosylglycohydrolase family protein [Methylacidiphilales bacterium]|nr:ADP-ribosylglycohydrolase family protein [Candidatus Methylacidiphilales bacterium]
MATLTAEAPLSVRERYAGLLYGALAGDSLALGAHWIYDQAEIAHRWGRVMELEAAAPDSYHPGKGRGAQTHYGDQTLVLLESLEACCGNFVMDDFARRWRGFWDDSAAYRDHATKETLAHLQEGLGLTRAGSDSTELGGAARIAPLLAALRNEDAPTIIAAARAQTALTHATPAAVDAAEFIARTVFLLMRGVTVSSALPMAATLPYKALRAEDLLRRAQETGALSTAKAVEQLGASCPLDKALPSVFAILLRHGDNFEEALVENVMAGGDSAARGLVLGTILGAAHGRRAIPARWSEPLAARTKVDAFLKTVGL